MGRDIVEVTVNVRPDEPGLKHIPSLIFVKIIIGVELNDVAQAILIAKQAIKSMAGTGIIVTEEMKSGRT